MIDCWPTFEHVLLIRPSYCYFQNSNKKIRQYEPGPMYLISSTTSWRSLSVLVLRPRRFLLPD
jgi:hypothetical protein